MVLLRLTQLLTFLALLIAPFGMMSGHAAMATGAAAQARHPMAGAPCGAMDQPAKHKPASGVDCTIACSMLAGTETQIDLHPLAAAPPLPLPLLAALHGLQPESDPPPPRFA